MKESPAILNAFVPGERFLIGPAGPGTLNGLQFAVKDLFDIKGRVTGAGNVAWKEQHGPATKNAIVIDLLLNEGATCVGKTITDELAFSLDGENAHYGAPDNPDCPGCITGGSSSGSASLVAHKAVDFALGTDTAGSVRVPASFCGVYGYRPTHNAVPADGVHPLAGSFDVVGWFANSSDILEKVGEVLIKEKTEKQKFKKIILCEELFSMISPEYKPVFGKIIDLLKQKTSGVELKKIFDNRLPEIVEMLRNIQWWEFNQEHGRWIFENLNSFGEEIRGRIENIGTVTKDDYIREKTTQKKFTEQIKEMIGDEKIIIFPTVNDKAPRKGRNISEARKARSILMNYTCLSTVTGLPQVSIPVKKGIDRPIGLSVVAPWKQDEALFEYVKEIEQLL